MLSHHNLAITAAALLHCMSPAEYDAKKEAVAEEITNSSRCLCVNLWLTNVSQACVIADVLLQGMSPAEYEAKKEAVADEICARLEKLFPGLRAAIEFREVRLPHCQCCLIHKAKACRSCNNSSSSSRGRAVPGAESCHRVRG